jgi:hypothetical protein
MNEFGKDLGLLHEVVVTSKKAFRKVAGNDADYAMRSVFKLLAHDSKVWDVFAPLLYHLSYALSKNIDVQNEVTDLSADLESYYRLAYGKEGDFSICSCCLTKDAFEIFSEDKSDRFLRFRTIVTKKIESMGLDPREIEILCKYVSVDEKGIICHDDNTCLQEFIDAIRQLIWQRRVFRQLFCS